MVFPSQTAKNRTVQVATAGEALIDLIEEPDGRLRPCAGGAVYNLTRALGLQGVDTLYLNPLSQDRFGRWLADGLAEANVQQALAAPVMAPTSLAVVGLDAEGKASYSFYRDGVADRQVSATSLNAACTPQTLFIVATGCLALMPQDTDKYLPWLKTQRTNGKLVVVDANLRPAILPDMASYRVSVMQALAEAHIIKVSDDDLIHLGYEQPNAIDGARALLNDTQARWMAVTLGPRGAALLERGGHGWYAVETPPVKVADTVGAGDCFLAGLLVALLENTATAQQGNADALKLGASELQAMLAHALASASLCVEQTGCVPPSRAEVRKRLASVTRTFQAI